MKFFARLRQLVSAARMLSRRTNADREMDAELRSHIELHAEDLIRAGMSRDDALRQARLAFGGLDRAKEECRDTMGISFFESLLQDVRFGLRMLRKNPGFTIVSVLTLALGIGTNTAIFSIVNAVLFRPLPFADSTHLVLLWDSYGQPGNTSPVSYPNFVDWRSWNQSFDGVAAYTGGDYVLTGQGDPVHLEGMIASASLFQVLGIQPVLGRRFTPQEDDPHADDGADAVILSYKTWAEIFQRNPKVVGQAVTFDGKPFVVVGVAPAGVESLIGSGVAQFWTTAAPLAEISPQSPKPLSQERQISFLNVVGRLKPGFGSAQAQADMDRVAAELEKAYPKDDAKEGVIIKGLRESMTGNVRPLLLILLTAVGLVLLIACANVAALIFGRASVREREMAIRASLGASRWRIARQLLVECALLAFIGGAAGFWMAFVAKNSLIEVLGVTWLANVPLDGRVLGFALFATAASSLIFGFAPALRSARPDLIESLKEGGHGAGKSPRVHRLRQALVAGEAAVAVALLSAAALVAQSLIHLQRTDPGFDAANVLTFPISLPEQQYPQTSWSSFFAELTQRLRAVPGIVSASAASNLPLAGRQSRMVIDNVAGAPIPMNKRRGIAFVAVTPGYFATMRIPIRDGREFTDHDTNGSEPVVLLNQAAARQYFGNGNAVGQQIEPLMWNGTGSKTEMRTVVGVVGNVKYNALAQPAGPTIYWPLAQIPSNGTMYLTVRTGIDPAAVVSEARAQLAAMDKTLPLFDVWPMDHYLDQTLAQSRYNTLLMSSFAALALILTTIGIYGSIAYTVVQRTREIGIRMALGAEPHNVLTLVLREGLILAGVGVAGGLCGALALTRFLRSLLYEIKPNDPSTFVAVGILLMVVALLATYIPARRAMRIDPVTAMRSE